MNNVISGLESKHPEVIREFLGRLSLARTRSNMPGLLLNGKQMDNFTAATTCKNTNTPTGSIKSENQAINMLI